MHEIVDLDKLNAGQTRRLNAISRQLRKEYGILINTISLQVRDKLCFYLSNLASRDVYHSGLFEKLVILAYADSLLKQDNICIKTSDKILVATLRQKYSYGRILPGYADNKSEPGAIHRSLLLYSSILFRLLNRYFVSSNREYIDRKFVLLDMFVNPDNLMESTINSRIDVSHYYGNLFKYLGSADIKHIYFYPIFFGSRIVNNTCDIMKKSGINFIMPDNYLGLLDYIWIFYKAIRIKYIKFRNVQFQGFCIDNILAEECKDRPVSWNNINGLLNYRFLKRFSESESSKGLVKYIQWSENQTLNKGMCLGFHVYLPNVKVLAYKAFPVSRLYLQHNIPTGFEVGNHLHPENVGVVGTGYAGQVDEFTDSINLETCPALRYENIHHVDRYRNTGKPRLLVALSMTMHECISMLDMVAGMPEIHEFKDMEFMIKPHPLFNGDMLHALVRERGLTAYLCKDLHKEYLKVADILLTDISGMAMSAIVLGMQVVFKGRAGHVSYIPVPDNINRELWCLIYSRDEAVKAINTMARKILHVSSGQNGCSPDINRYFSRPDRNSVRNFLSLDECSQQSMQVN